MPSRSIARFASPDCATIAASRRLASSASRRSVMSTLIATPAGTSAPITGATRVHNVRSPCNERNSTVERSPRNAASNSGSSTSASAGAINSRGVRPSVSSLVHPFSASASPYAIRKRRSRSNTVTAVSGRFLVTARYSAPDAPTSTAWVGPPSTASTQLATAQDASSPPLSGVTATVSARPSAASDENTLARARQRTADRFPPHPLGILIEQLLQRPTDDSASRRAEQIQRSRERNNPQQTINHHHHELTVPTSAFLMIPG